MKDHVIGKALALPLEMATEAGLELGEDFADLRDLSGTYRPVDWNRFADLLNLLEALVGDDLESLVELITLRNKPYELFAKTGGLFCSPRNYFWMANHCFAPVMFPPLKIEEEFISNEHVEIRCQIPGELKGSRAFFRICAKAFEVSPILMGMKRAKVSWSAGSHQASFSVDLPPSLSLFSRVKRMIDGAMSSKTFMSELVSQAEVMEENYIRVRRSEQSFRNLLEVSPAAILIAKDKEIRYANKSLLALSSYPDCESLFKISLTELLSKGRVLEVHREGHHPSRLHPFTGDPIPVKVVEIETDFLGEEVRLLFIEDLRLRNEIIARALDMDRLITTGTLTAAITHEINNPLTLVTMNLDFLEQELEKTLFSLSPEKLAQLGVKTKDLDDLREALLGAERGTEKALQITREIKNVGRQPSEELDLVDPRDAVEGALRLLGPEVRLLATISKSLEPVGRVYTSLPRVQQVVLNCILNGIDAIEESQSSGPHELKIYTGQTGGHCFIEIHDTGDGIAPEYLDQIFEPFFTTKPLGSGTGLGLFVSKDIIQRLGGELELESTPGKGTVARILLPLST